MEQERSSVLPLYVRLIVGVPRVEAVHHSVSESVVVLPEDREVYNDRLIVVVVVVDLCKVRVVTTTATSFSRVDDNSRHFFCLLYARRRREVSLTFEKKK